MLFSATSWTAATSRLARLWLSLQPSWLMMALEIPVVLSWLGAQSDQIASIAAFGIFHSIALSFEAPVLMLLPTTTQLSNGPKSFHNVHVFSIIVIIIATITSSSISIIPAIRSIFISFLFNTDKDIEKYITLMFPCLSLWPAAIGYRRTLQGLLLAHGRANVILQASLFRFLGILAGLGIGSLRHTTPALWAAVALLLGVIFEAAYTGIAVWVSGLANKPAGGADKTDRPIRPWEFLQIYTPLSASVTTSLMLPGAISVILSRSNDPVLALAVFPIVHGFGFVFRSVGLAMQEIFIVGLKGSQEEKKAVHALYSITFIVLAISLLLVGLTPIAQNAFVYLMNVGTGLARQASVTFLFALPYPLLTLALSRERASAISLGISHNVVAASFTEFVLCVSVAYSLIQFFGIDGAIAAVMGLNTGRLSAIGLLRRKTGNRTMFSRKSAKYDHMRKVP